MAMRRKGASNNAPKAMGADPLKDQRPLRPTDGVRADLAGLFLADHPCPIAQTAGLAFGNVSAHWLAPVRIRITWNRFRLSLSRASASRGGNTGRSVVPSDRPRRAWFLILRSLPTPSGFDLKDFGSCTWLGKPELSLPCRFVRPVKQSCHEAGESGSGICTTYPQARADSVHEEAARNFTIQVGCF